MFLKKNWGIYTNPPQITTPTYFAWEEEDFFIFLKSPQPVTWTLIEGDLFTLEKNRLSLGVKLRKGDMFHCTIGATDEYNNIQTQEIVVEFKKKQPKVHQEVQPIPSNFRISKS